MNRQSSIAVLASLLIMIAIPLLGQDTNWELVSGKAVASRSYELPGRDARTIYREVNRWLVRMYSNPEELIKARIDDEYLRGVGHRSSFVRLGDVTDADLHYVFVFEVQASRLTLRFQEAKLVYTHATDYHTSPVEHYFAAGAEKNAPHGHDPELVKHTLNAFADELFLSLGNQLEKMK
jgi:hypothetical protein